MSGPAGDSGTDHGVSRDVDRLVENLIDGVRDRAEAWTQIEKEWAAASGEAARTKTRRVGADSTSLKAEHTAMTERAQKARAKVDQRYGGQLAAAEKRKLVLLKAERDWKQGETQSRVAKRTESSWLAGAMLETAQNLAAKERASVSREFKLLADRMENAAEALQKRANSIEITMPELEPESGPAASEGDSPMPEPMTAKGAIEETRGLVEGLESQIRSLFRGSLLLVRTYTVLVVLVFAVVCGVAALSFTLIDSRAMQLLCMGVGLALAIGGTALIRVKTRGAASKPIAEALRALHATSARIERARVLVEDGVRGRLIAAERKHQEEEAQIGVRFERACEDLESAYVKRFYDTETTAEIEIQRVRARRELFRDRVDRAYRSLITGLNARREFREHEIRGGHEAAMAGAVERRESRLNEARAAWSERLGTVREAAAGIQRGLAEREGLAIVGTTTLVVGQLEGIDEADESFEPVGQESFELPVVLDGGNGWSMACVIPPDGRRGAVRLMQGALSRVLSVLPPNRLRLTIADPVGLGETFAGFMRLADTVRNPITKKIWTTPQQIEEEIALLAEHMERIIQFCLRDEYTDLVAYNRAAGPTAEPHRFLVLADYPTGLNERAAGRLRSLVEGGARCGIHVLAFGDASSAPDRGVPLPELLHTGLGLELGEDGACVATRGPLVPWPIQVEAPPSEQRLAQTLASIASRAEEALDVRVPFAEISPTEPDEVWATSSADELVIPIGRRGAGRPQELRLGQGTRQHALVAGKTGSGKSTLFHVLIANAALMYSPDELELYLVDFKKGVEFQAYARSAVPHARVVGVETDREFGLSVLRKLDEELRERGERFRESGTQDLPSHRRQTGEAVPRVLLVIDEFQELFSDDDHVAQEAASLLDRLVRQGRAFGIHAVLGTQSLAGAHAVARSTLGQIGVRIAMQTSEADSYLILGEDNPVAKTLGRPGQAVYNDDGGQVSGNSPFQVAWLDAEERDASLARVADLEETERHCVVFEGNVPASLSDNPRLRERAEVESAPQVPVAWLGEPVAIKPSLALSFPRQAGANAVLVGQNEHVALGLMYAAALSLSRQFPEGESPVCLLDTSAEESVGSSYLRSVCEQTGARWLDLTAVDELMTTMETRLDLGDRDTPVFLLIHGVHRVRALRRREDEFAFGARDSEKASRPDQIFERLISEGPAAGIHTLMWSDSAASLGRVVDRRVMREFEQRVLLQMSVTDSAGLIDSPRANSLGLNRALLYSEVTGRIQVFRPYALPEMLS
ncbi:MAG: S-DNA-T family DNA segregation ATPase FtsK/SpoIIIE [Phycisphaerales bacterium]